MSKDAVEQEARFKYGPEHEHRPRERCPVSACTWPLRWETAPPIGGLVVMPLRPSIQDAVELWGADIRGAGFDRAMKEIEMDPSVLKAQLAPQPVDLFKRDLEVPASVHPEPLVPVRAAREVEIPSAARSVRKLAEANGWRVQVTYALGWVLGARGETRSLTHTVALRLFWQVQVGGVARHAVAVWSVKEPNRELADAMREHPGDPDHAIIVPTTGWKFDLAYGWGPGQPHHKLSAAALKETIKEA